MKYPRAALLALLALSLHFSLSCNERADKNPATGETPKIAALAHPEQTAADELGSDLVPPEDVSSETVRDAKSGPLVLPTSFGRRTGDLDEMVKDRRIRALVVINPIGFFYSLPASTAATLPKRRRWRSASLNVAARNVCTRSHATAGPTVLPPIHRMFM